MTKRQILLSTVAVLALSLSSFGQTGATALTSTTLSAAVADGATRTFQLASVTGITAGGTVLVIEDGTAGFLSNQESVFVNAVNTTSKSVTVQRAYYGNATGHIKGAVILIATPAQLVNVDPSGACTAASTVNPTINPKSGNQWICSSVTNSWVPGWFNLDAQTGVSAAVASVAGATLPSGPLFHVTGVNAITAWGSTTAIGAVGAGGSATDVIGANFCVIPDAIFTTTATNNIALASTSVVNKLLCFTFDQTNKKYVPSY